VNLAQSSQRFARARGLLITIAVASVAIVPGCTRDYGQLVAIRLADIAHGPTSEQGLRTWAYPRVTLRDETRVVLSNLGRSAPLSRTHFVATVTLPPAATLEFGYALIATKDLAAPVFFSVSVNDGQDSSMAFETSIAAEPETLARWHDARVDLSAWGGKKVDIVFQTSAATLGIDPASGGINAAGYFSAGVITTAAAEPQPRNVVLISIDTLRADHLGIYGYTRPTSVQIDRIFGERGLTVERMFSNATTTLPGHAAMLFGLSPSVALEPSGNVERIVAPSTSLAEVLRAYGFRTAAFTENAWLTADLGFVRGFETYVEEREPGTGKAVIGHVRQTFDAGLTWIKRHRDGPFFVFLHTYQVHSPYTPPAAFDSLFPTPTNPSQTRSDLDNYDRELVYTDEEVGKLIHDLTNLGLLEHTLLILTSDHGEEFGEHGYRYHGPTLHDEVLRVPLLMLAPGLLPQSVRRPGPMSLVDLAPTILGLLQYPIPQSFHGRNMASHISTGSEVDHQPIFSETHVPFAISAGENPSTWVPPAFAVTLWPHRVVSYNTKQGIAYERYNLETDPLENKNIADDSDSTRFAALRALLQNYETTAAAEQSRLRSMASSLPATNAPVVLGQDIIDKLQALGYLE